jgi:2-polyprenyl-3-methyl-5-hydroxy-6-metoxy-1,4-benzoquinol methylase
MTSNQDKIAKRWSENRSGSEAFSASVYWLAVPEVQQYFQKRATLGRSTNWVNYCVQEFLGKKTPVQRMVSFGCGTGDLERHLAGLNAFQSCTAYDIAPAAIEEARQRSLESGISNIDYQLCDMEELDMPAHHYDVAWFNGSLHHISELDSVCRQVAQTLKPDGYLFFNEYVGPNRFNLTDRQKEVIEAAFKLIPKRYRRSFVIGHLQKYQKSPMIPDPRQVCKADPSEAVRSSDIMSTVEKHFNVVAENPCGGTLLQFLMHGIAGNFRTDDPKSIAILEMLFTIEETLIQAGDIQSDFVVVVAQPKS